MMHITCLRKKLGHSTDLRSFGEMTYLSMKVIFFSTFLKATDVNSIESIMTPSPLLLMDHCHHKPTCITCVCLHSVYDQMRLFRCDKCCGRWWELWGGEAHQNPAVVSFTDRIHSEDDAAVHVSLMSYQLTCMGQNSNNHSWFRGIRGCRHRPEFLYPREYSSIMCRSHSRVKSVGNEHSRIQAWILKAVWDFPTWKTCRNSWAPLLLMPFEEIIVPWILFRFALVIHWTRSAYLYTLTRVRQLLVVSIWTRVFWLLIHTPSLYLTFRDSSPWTSSRRRWRSRRESSTSRSDAALW